MKGTRRSEEQIITFGARLWCETESMESTNGGLHPQFSDGHERTKTGDFWYSRRNWPRRRCEAGSSKSCWKRIGSTVTNSVTMGCW